MAGVIYARNRFGAADNADALVFSLTPKPGYFYQPKKGDTIWAISNQAYKKPGYTSVKNGLMLINNSSWNSYIQKGPKGWEAYKVNGIQLTPNYTPNEQSSKGSGKSYPTLWLPPLNGKEPGDMVPAAPQQGERGATGAVGAQGPKGDKGEPGRPPTPAEIQSGIASYLQQNPIQFPGVDQSAVTSLISDFLSKNPPQQGATGPAGRAPTPAEIRTAVQAEMKANPPQRGAQGERGPQGLPGEMPAEAVASLINDYLAKNPIQAVQGQQGPQGAAGPAGRPPTPAEIQSAVNKYMSDHAPVTGGGQGPRGARGPQGPAPSPAQIQSAVSQWMSDNPPKQTGGGFEIDKDFMDMAKGLVDSRIRAYARKELPKLQSSSGGASLGMILFSGIIGGGITAFVTKRSRKRKPKLLESGKTWLR